MRTTWMMRPDAREDWLSSVQWRIATHLRLGSWNGDDDLRCRRTNRDNETCDRPIGRGALDCKSSTSRTKLHNSMCRALHEQLRRLGADVEDECAVPELSRWWYELDEWKCHEALLDLSVNQSGAWIPRRLTDITVRDPGADRHQPETQHRPETAQARATTQKMRGTHQRMEHMWRRSHSNRSEDLERKEYKL